MGIVSPTRALVKRHEKFGRLVVVGIPFFVILTKRRYQFVVVECECGSLLAVDCNSLRSGNSKSCGCLKRDMISERLTSHGKSGTKLYHVWGSMLARCRNKGDASFAGYGGRGISVAKEWLSFAVFEDWAVRNGYREGLTIERRENDGNYEPDNCVWIPRVDQAKNTRRTKWIEAFGERKSMAEWACDGRCVVSYSLLRHRMSRKMSPEQAMTQAVRHEKNRSG